MTILLPDMHPREMSTYFHTKTCSRMLLTALFIIAQTGEQPKCPSREQINQS